MVSKKAQQVVAGGGTIHPTLIPKLAQEAAAELKSREPTLPEPQLSIADAANDGEGNDA